MTDVYIGLYVDFYLLYLETRSQEVRHNRQFLAFYELGLEKTCTGMVEYCGGPKYLVRMAEHE